MVTSISPTFCVPPLFIPASVLHALRFKPRARFVNADHSRLEFLAEFDGVGNVIEMAVRDEHRIDAIDFLERPPGVIGFV